MTIQKPDSARHSEADPATGEPTSERTGSRLWLGLVALLPIACCGLPLLLASGVAVGAGAILGGIAGAVLLVVALVLAAVTLRRAAACRTDPGAAGEPGKDSCS